MVKKYLRKFRTFLRILFKEKDPRIKKFLLIGRTLTPVLSSKSGRLIKKILRPTCSFFPKSIVILSDGSVTTCCFDPFGFNKLGSVYEQDIVQIWEKKIRGILFSGDLLSLKQCKECVGLSHLRLFTKKSEYLKWQNFGRSYPVTIQLEVMASCNYGCCYSGQVYKYRNNQQTKPDLDKIFDNIKSLLPNISCLSLFNFGEPLLHEGFCDFVRKIRKYSEKMYLSLATNGMLLDENIARCLIEQKVDEVSISIHGGAGTENMLKYSKYNADYDRVMANVRLLTGLRREYNSKFPYIEIKTILFNWNDNDEAMERLRKDVRASGADKINWTLDCLTTGSPRASRRFVAGSGELKNLQHRDIFA